MMGDEQMAGGTNRRNQQSMYPFLKAATEHWSAIVPTTLVLLTVARLLAVSRGDEDTALGILQHADTGKLLIGVAVTSLPLVVVYIAAGLVIFNLAPWWIAVAASILGLGFIPLIGYMLLGVALTATALTAITPRLLPESRDPGRIFRPLLRGAMLLVMVATLVLLLVIDAMWLPLERVAIEQAVLDRTIEVDGYILSVDDRNVVVLDQRRREVTSYRGTLVRRVTCDTRADEWDYRVPASFLFGRNHQPNYPDC